MIFTPQKFIWFCSPLFHLTPSGIFLFHFLKIGTWKRSGFVANCESKQDPTRYSIFNKLIGCKVMVSFPAPNSEGQNGLKNSNARHYILPLPYFVGTRPRIRQYHLEIFPLFKSGLSILYNSVLWIWHLDPEIKVRVFWLYIWRKHMWYHLTDREH